MKKTLPNSRANSLLPIKRIYLIIHLLFASILTQATTITSTSGGGNWNAASSWNTSSGGGLILASTFSPGVSGIGTSFLTQLAVGSIIYNGTIVGTVASIQSNTSLTLTSNAAQLIAVGVGYTAQIVPSSTDDVVIAPGATVTVSSNGSINSVTFSNSGSSTSTLNVNSGFTLNIATGITLQNRASGSTAANIGGAGSINCASIAVGSNTAPTTNSTTHTHQLTSSITSLSVSGNILVVSRIGTNNGRIANGSFLLSSGTLTVDGNISTTNGDAVNSSTFSLAANPQSATLIFNGNSTFNLSGTGNNIITLNGSSSTVAYSSNGAQTIPAYNYANLSSSGNGARTLSNSGVIGIAGSFSPGTNTYTITGSTINFNGSGTQFIPAFNFYNLTLNNSITLTNSDTVTNTLSFGGSNRTLTTGGLLTLKSTSAGTARIADITNGGNSTGNTVNGTVTMECYIPATKGWRLLSVPISSTGAPTINAAWQEGLTTASSNPNLYPGYGIKIAGGTTANGFDQSNTNSTFIKTYNSSNNSFVALPASPGTHTPITNNAAYLIYTRGDRSINLMQGLAAAITSTTLRVKGQINTGNQVKSIDANNYTLIGNPYPSAIDFGALTRANVSNSMYIWDPKMSGNSGLGSYVTVSWNNATGNYDVTTSTSAINRYIPSGEAFFVRSQDHINPGTLTIKETDKATSTSNVFRVNGIARKLIANLYLVTDSSSSLLDGTLVTFDDMNSNTVDEDDAVKMINSGETIGLSRDNNLLSIERRKLIGSADTMFLNISRMKIRSYKFEIIAENLATPGIIGFLKDNYLNTISAIDMNASTSVSFSINSDPASYAADRFSIVFTSQTPLPVSIRSVKAFRLHEDVQVEWKAESEINISAYDVERSEDGRSFTKIQTVPAIASNGGNASYKLIDTDPVDGNNYYRIRSVEQNGKSSYSITVKVDMESATAKTSIVVSSNPVTGNNILVYLNNVERGNYSLRLYNSAGQMIFSKAIMHDGISAANSISIGHGFVAGQYQLLLVSAEQRIITEFIKE